MQQATSRTLGSTKTTTLDDMSVKRGRSIASEGESANVEFIGCLLDNLDDFADCHGAAFVSQCNAAHLWKVLVELEAERLR